MLWITSINFVFLLAAWSFATFGIAHDIDGLNTVDKRAILKLIDGMEAPVFLDLKYLPRAEPATVTITETVCEFETTTSVEGTITLSIPETSTAASTTEINTSQSTEESSVLSATRTVPTTVSHVTTSASSADETTTHHRSSSTDTSIVSSPMFSETHSPTAPPLSDVASGQENSHMILMACGLILAGILNM